MLYSGGLTMANEVANMFLVNAPAGSGKSTFIEETVLGLLTQQRSPRILCITYTNRAAEELINRISSPLVTIQTIHSFVSTFISLYFKDPEIIDLYFEIYGNEIENNLFLCNKDGSITDTNERFAKKFGDLTIDNVKKNLKEIKYNELQFNSLYYGGLSHDDLLSFTKLIFSRYPILKKRLVDKHNYIFIDEYQDTADSVLFMFFNAVKGTDTELYILGDKMQQIYENYRGDFEPYLKHFSTDIKLNKNFRSTELIITLLNNLYNDPAYMQQANDPDEIGEVPQLLISDNPEAYLQDRLADNHSLKLLLFNRSRFEAVGASELYEVVSKMASYSFPSKYSPVDVLTNPTVDNPDILFRKLFHIITVVSYYKNQAYGSAIQAIKKSTTFVQKPFLIIYHKDKTQFSRNMKYLYHKLFSETGVQIGDFIKFCIQKDFINKDAFFEIERNEEYNAVLSVPVIEFTHVYQYLENPHVSTQHGVKGEGHDSVYFFAEDSSQPYVRIYDLFQMITLSDININLTEFQGTYYKYCSMLEAVDQISPVPLRDLKKDQFIKIEPELTNVAKHIYGELKDNPYFKYLQKDFYDKYLNKPLVGSAKKCFSASKIRGVLSA